MSLDLLSRVLTGIPALPKEYLQCTFYDAPLLNPLLQIIDIEPHRNYRSKAEFHGKFSIFWNIDSNLFEKIEWPILLNEAITLLGEVGYLVIATRDNENGALFGLKNLVYRHPLRKVELIDQFNTQNGLIISVIRVEKIGFDINPSKNWSFVFLSNGKKAERIKSTISQIYVAKESFETLNKSEIDVEILILGPRLNGVTNLPVRYFDEFIAPKDNTARIGAKKNFGLSMATNPNVCLLHDRFSLDPNFFNNFDAWGYDFDYLTVEQFFDSGEKFSPILGFDEFSYKKIQMFYYENSYQYHPNGYINGGFIILKKYLHQFCNFNPLLLHIEAEDIEIANVLINFGILPRVNMYTYAKTEYTPVLNNLLRK